MAKKRNTAPEPIASGGAVPARTRKHTPATHVVPDSSMSTDSISTAPNADSNPVVTESTPQYPEYEAIARLAYAKWEARGYEAGSPEEDWLQAEQELRRNLTFSAKA
jgi:DUF2934 family protein